jgi:hypothetical protein
MLPASHLAVVTRNETWETGPVATEPYECGWAREALVFIRALKPPALRGGIPRLRVEVSPDGMHWTPEGTTIALPGSLGEQTFARVTQFGGWLRLAGEVPAGGRITVLVSLHLKA